MLIRAGILIIAICLFVGCGDSTKEDHDIVLPAHDFKLGLRLIPTFCNTCHGVGDRREDEMLAPPLWGVRAHYLKAYPEADVFVDSMADFIAQPDAKKSLMPKALKRYGLMSPTPLDESKLRAIAMAIHAGHVERPPWSRSYEKVHRDCVPEEPFGYE